MKNLPDKIYLSFGEMSEEKFEKEDYKELCEYSELVVPNEQKIWKTDVEYIRTDAFIEKACEFINKANLYLYHCISEECDLVDTDKMIGDFKNYMKGE